MKTIILDIDGTLLTQTKPVAKQLADNDYPEESLPGVIEKLHEWEGKGYKVAIITGRRECWRKFTEEQLFKLGIWYDKLIMDMGSGQRILVNDLKPYHDEPTAVAVNLPRNQGIGDLEI